MGCWRRAEIDVRTESPSGRGGHGSVRIGKEKLLVFGGADRSPVGFNDLWLLELRNKLSAWTWTRINVKLSRGSQRPIPRSGCSLLFVNDKVYAFGGQEPTTGVILDELLMLDLHTWELQYICPRTSGPRPVARHSHTAGVIGKDTIIIFGGSGLRGPLNDVWIYCTQTNLWTCLSNDLAPQDCPQPREMAAGCIISDAGLLVHGGRGSEGDILSDVAIFDSRAAKWVLFQSTPYARCAHTATSINFLGEMLTKEYLEQQTVMSPDCMASDEQQQDEGIQSVCIAADATFQGYDKDAPQTLASKVLLYGGFTGETVSGDLLQLCFVREKLSEGVMLKVELQPVKLTPPVENAEEKLPVFPAPRFAHSAVVLQQDAKAQLVVFGGVNQIDDLNDVQIWVD